MKQLLHFGLLSCILLVFSCKKNDPTLPDNTISFQASSQGLSSDSSSATIKLTIGRAANTAIALSVGLKATGAAYGTQFTTTPAATNGSLGLSIPAGSTSVSFVVSKVAGAFFSGTETVKFTLSNITSPVIAGQPDSLVLSFGSIVSVGSQIQLEGKTSASNYTNSVFVDFSNNSQSDVDRKSWNLGFYSGSNFRVILNPGYQTTAAALSKTDISAVGLADTASVPNLNHDLNDPATKALVDDWNGHLDSTVFGDISATADANRVFLISFEGAKSPKSSWYKVRVTRSGEGYSVQYAKIGETTIRTLAVAKNASYNFVFASLETDKTVGFEPAKTDWDIEWSYSTYNSGLGSPYWFQDFVLLNYAGGAQAAMVLTSTVSYANFAESHLSAVTWSSTRDAIGSSWRVTTGTGIYRDRFYVVRDPRGNVYKLQFVSMGVGADGGERGRPIIQYALVKKV